MKVIIDTNIVFSALLNSDGSIGKVLFNNTQKIEFYSCSFLEDEIYKHWKKLLKISLASDAELLKSYNKIKKQIYFIDQQIISDHYYSKTKPFMKNVDENDIDFVALSFFLNCKIWTGDKELINGLQKNNFNKIITTESLLKYIQ